MLNHKGYNPQILGNTSSQEGYVFMSGKSRWDYLKAIYLRDKKVSSH